MSPPNLCDFFRHLPASCLERNPRTRIGRRSRDRGIFLHNPALYANDLDQGFLKWTSKVFYTPVSETNLCQLAVLSDNYAEPEVASALRVYSDGRIVLSWHDLPDDPIYIDTYLTKAPFDGSVKGSDVFMKTNNPGCYGSANTEFLHSKLSASSSPFTHSKKESS